MNYSEAEQWLYTQLPVYHRIGAAAYKEDITNTIKLCNYFNNPQDYFKSVHIAGTNGKGSTSHIIAAVLQEAGYKVGLYTSPHLKSFTERIKINGKEIDCSYIANFITKNKDFFKSFDPSFFEITVAMAFLYFKQEKVDIAIIETGLGGRLDSTNIITPILSVITNIGFDHVDLLGNSLDKIAFEKAGIIKNRVPVIIGEQQKEIAPVFIKKASEMKANIVFADDVLTLLSSKTIFENKQPFQQLTYTDSKKNTIEIITDQLGIYQQHNCKTAWVALQEIKKIGFDKISKENEISGFKKISEITGLKGRWQILDKNPTVIADTGHNVDGIKYIITQLKYQDFKKLRIVIGFVNDKNIDSILNILPPHAIYYFTQASIPRALPAIELQKRANELNLQGSCYNKVIDAYKCAKQESDSNDLIFIGGSTFVVAEMV